MLEKIIEAYDEDKKIKVADGFDDAIIGIDEKSMRLIYSVKKTVQILAKTMTVTKADLSEEENCSGVTIAQKKYELALEYFEFNVKGSWVGERTPIWCEDNFQ